MTKSINVSINLFKLLQKVPCGIKYLAEIMSAQVFNQLWRRHAIPKTCCDDGRAEVKCVTVATNTMWPMAFYTLNFNKFLIKAIHPTEYLQAHKLASAFP